jgi:hypothetical protein
MDWATFWVIFSKAHLVALLKTQRQLIFNARYIQHDSDLRN